MGRCPPKPSGGRFIKEKCWISNRFVKGAGRYPTKPSGGRFIKENRWISNRFVKGARIVEYGPVPAEAVRGKIYKGKVLDFQ